MIMTEAVSMKAPMKSRIRLIRIMITHGFWLIENSRSTIRSETFSLTTIQPNTEAVAITNMSRAVVSTDSSRTLGSERRLNSR